MTEWGGCHECGEPVTVLLEDELLGEAGPLTLECMNGHEFFVPAEATARSRIGKIRAIVRDHQAARVEGYLVDAFTAGMLLAIYNALGAEARAKFGQPSLPRLVDFGWKHVT